MVESWLYNLATLLLFHSDTGQITSSIDWKKVEDCFEVSIPTQPINHRFSPFLGGAHLIYKLIIQVTTYGRQDDDPHDIKQAYIRPWLRDLDSIETGLTRYKLEFPGDVGSLYLWKHRLYVIALRILLATISDRTITASSNTIKELVTFARAICLGTDLREGNNPALAWPLIVLLCASDDDATFDVFASITEEICDNFDPGHRHRLTIVIDMVRRMRREAVSGSATRYQEPLSLLSRRGGILSSV